MKEERHKKESTGKPLSVKVSGLGEDFLNISPRKENKVKTNTRRFFEMKKLITMAMAVLLIAGLNSFAVEYELIPGSGFVPLGLQELSNDDGTADTFGSLDTDEYYNTITTGYDCWLTKVKVYIGGTGTGDIMVDVLADVSGAPDDGNSLIGGELTYTYDGTEGWLESTEFTTPIWLDTDTVTHPGQSSGITDAGLGRDGDTTGSGGTWFNTGSAFEDQTTTYGYTMARLIVNDDTDAPYADTFDHQDTYQLPGLDEIAFHSVDDDASSGGVDITTVSFNADDGSKGAVLGVLSFNTDDPNDVICTFDVDDGYDFPDGATVSCTVPAGMKDMLGNEQTSEYNWEFYIDGTPPNIDNQNPENGARIYPDQDIITFHIVDTSGAGTGVGVDTSSINFSCEDGSGVSVPGDLTIDDTDPCDVVCTFDINDEYDFPVTADVSCIIAHGLADLLGNETIATIVWQYDVVSPYADNADWEPTTKAMSNNNTEEGNNSSIENDSLGHIKALFE